MSPVEYKKAQANRHTGFNYFYHSVYNPYDLGLLVYPIEHTGSGIQHSRWDVEVEAIPGSDNAILYIRPTSDLDVNSWTQGEIKLLMLEEGAAHESAQQIRFTDFQSAPDHAVAVLDLSGKTTAVKLKIIIGGAFM